MLSIIDLFPVSSNQFSIGILLDNSNIFLIISFAPSIFYEFLLFLIAILSSNSFIFSCSIFFDLIMYKSLWKG